MKEVQELQRLVIVLFICGGILGVVFACLALYVFYLRQEIDELRRSISRIGAIGPTAGIGVGGQQRLKSRLD
jgi:hypothetical protein